MKQPYRFIDAFCGAGGLALGLRQAGFDDAVSFDADEHAVETFRTNISPRVFVARAQDICGKDLLKRAEIDGQLDLFAGGPPCQGFSKQKRGAHLGDERNSLVLEFARLVRETSPRFFLLENVDQLGKKRGRGFLADVQDELQNYVLFPHFYNSADYGLAQTRIRFVIIGRRRDVAAGYRVPVPTVTQWVTVGDVLSGLPEPPENYSEHPYFPNHYRARVTPINIKRFSYVPQGGGWWDIPDKLRLQCHRNVDRGSGGWPDVYGRLKLDGQAPTLTAGFDSFTRGRYGHPLYDRPLTPREAARLQGFPDNYRFYGTRWHVRSQIGNAVPPPLAMVIGASIRRSLDLADGKLQTRADDMSTTPAAVQLGFAMGLG